jgi:hypothetical protein
MLRTHVPTGELFRRACGQTANRLQTAGRTIEQAAGMDPEPAGAPIAIASAINVAVGCWVVFSPLTLGYPGTESIAPTFATGAVVALFAYLRAERAARSALLSWVNSAVGCWLVASGLWLRHDLAASLNEVIAGGLIVTLALVSALTEHE